MSVLMFFASLPIAVAMLAALLAARDRINGSWALVRASIYALVLLALLWLVGTEHVVAMGSAFVTVVILHTAGFYFGRWFFTGVK